MKKLFTENGFKIVYDKDEQEPIADGFYFTFSYPGLSGEDLLHELIYYGISAISLAICPPIFHNGQYQDRGDPCLRLPGTARTVSGPRKTPAQISS